MIFLKTQKFWSKMTLLKTFFLATLLHWLAFGQANKYTDFVSGLDYMMILERIQ
jgi:hypothetical protein